MTGQSEQWDMVIVGAGMVGLSLAVRLAQQQRRVALIEKHSQPQLTETLALRVSALNDRSRQVLQEAGVWQTVVDYRTGPYQQMTVWDKDSPAHIHFSAADVNHDDLGAIAENNVIEHYLWQQAERLGVEIIQADDWRLVTSGDDEHLAELQVAKRTLRCSLLMGADGGRSKVRQSVELPLSFWDYQQQGIVANIQTEFPHQGVARQVFLPTGPLALLPTSEPNTVSIVWSADQDFAAHLLAQSPQRLAKWVEAESGRVLGECDCDSEVKAFPLRMQYARNWSLGRVVLVGDAAHTIHPLAGQGANLGFADVRSLVAQLENVDLNDGRQLSRALGAYQRERKAQTQLMIGAMELFKRGFGSSNPLLKATRAVAFALPNRLAPLKRQLAEIALGQ